MRRRGSVGGDNTPPTLPTRSINVAGDTLTLTFSEAVTGTVGISINAPTSGAVATYSSGSGTATHTYTLSPVAVQGETVTLDYTPGDLVDGAGNPLAPISGASVTNGTGGVSLANITTLRTAGWTDIPDPSVTPWWITHPTAAEIKTALISPFRNDPGGAGICIKRLWLPHTLQAGVNYDASQMAICIATANSMHRQAMNAWYEYQINSDTTAGDTAMASAKSTFNSECDAKIASGSAARVFASFLVASNRCRDEVTACLALDWINWTDAAEFEAAFDKVKQLVEMQIASEESGSRNFRNDGTSDGEGYWNATHQSQSAFFVEALLALCVYGINTGGASHTWANGKIDQMGVDPTSSTTAVFSPWEQANTLNLISLGNGGGREWGANELGPSLGGYEGDYAYGATVVLHAVDTATNSNWSLVDNSLYLTTRYKGLEVIDDLTVEKTAFSSTCGGIVETWARLLDGTTAGERYSWLTGRSASHTSSSQLRELQALAGAKDTAVAPSGSFAGRIGSRWYYKEDLSLPDSTFRMYIHNRSLECHREIGDERTMGFAIGNIGLVSGHCNRCWPNGVVANGVWFGEKSAAGTPEFAANAWWTQGCSLGTYTGANRAVTPSPVANNSLYLVGSQTKPTLSGSTYSLAVDWSDWAGIYNSSANSAQADARVTGATYSWSLNTSTRQMIITDTITIDLSGGLYLGWHFSPSHSPTLITDGFEFTDGTDLIRVLVEPQGSFGLTRTVRTGATPFALDGYNLDLEWHTTSSAGSLGRIHSNVGFEPDTITGDNVYQVQVTITANPV